MTKLMISTIPAGWHIINYVKHVLFYREKSEGEKVINYLESKNNTWGVEWIFIFVIKGVIAFLIGIPSIIYLLYLIFFEIKYFKK
ncbi:hypothetical protein WKH57_01785 [Niallia taxi]|uniref:hypothetical protein n=1 Tax=Niallia taxi TaxID=2499688 RepID=UPI00316CC3EE